MQRYDQFEGKILYRGKPVKVEVEIQNVGEDQVTVRLLKTATPSLKRGLTIKLPRSKWDENMTLTKPYDRADFVPSFLKDSEEIKSTIRASKMSKSQYRLNKEIEQFVLSNLLEDQNNLRPYNQSDLQYVNQYKGYGGMWNYDADLEAARGLYEYYTPVDGVEKMVGLAYKHGYTGGAVLEPSCGIGRFLHYFSPKEKVVGIELDKVSATIAQMNFPNFTILNQPFNALFVDRRGKQKNFKPAYKLVIGNPPYGDFIGRMTSAEKKATEVRNYVEYFIYRGLDVLKPGGLLIYIIPSAFLDGSETPAKESIAQKSELLEAYRLPKRIFDQTDIQTDIIVLKKR